METNLASEEEPRNPWPRPSLILVATPIGNLGDMSARAIAALKDADRIAAEDTRTSQILLRRYGIATPCLPYHEHNAQTMRPHLLEALAKGERLALISDAGTPLISDPGYKLVREAIAADIPVTAVPGPSAPLMALILSGLPSDRFFFGGFLPPKPLARDKALHAYGNIPATLIFFESPRRLGATLSAMVQAWGPRPACVARELTKRHEEVLRGTLPELAAKFTDVPRGEIVIVVGPPLASAAPGEEEVSEYLEDLLRSHAPSRAAALAAQEFGLPRSALYRRALGLARRRK
ncbi:MAG TPA: 16S rRNA (cytidine(1402)-2'-O)-methyltransferase [Dongiaceae bacterium]|jgi:16S rRNA (cytidine1402-2'-O)-methyltransferase|nr:16S rRNA (cytidine(1402)-2'-O)-methyltransferase [Dongiaceae bacterium]